MTLHVPVTAVGAERGVADWIRRAAGAINSLIKPEATVNSYTVATLPSAATPAQIIYVSDETGGATLAFSDGSDWRRAQDRAVVS
jgi:hypothetical protein